MSPSPSRPNYFVDRSLGRHDLPTTLRALGWDLVTHHELYGPRDEDVPDVEWLEYCGRNDLPVLTKDKRLRHRPAEIAAIRSFGVRAFVLTSGSLRAEQQAERFHKNAKAIDAAAAGPGPVFSTQLDPPSERPGIQPFRCQSRAARPKRNVEEPTLPPTCCRRSLPRSSAFEFALPGAIPTYSNS